MTKKVVLLGSTGSIGENTLRVIEALSPRLKVVGLAVNRNYKRVLEQARRYNVRHVAVADSERAARCRESAPRGMKIYRGAEGVEELAALAGADVVLCAMVGMAGLRPVLAALKQGTDVALSTKEVLVAAGDIVTRTARRHNAIILPVDSEHSAIFQCLEGRTGTNVAGGQARRREDRPATMAGSSVAKIILTASGGPFAARPEIDFNKVTVEEALNHPKWNMGRKVTVDSATLMNKGLEVAEAHWFFGVPVEKIEVVIHPESIVHSLVEFVDGAMLAQLSVPDMRFAIQYALTCPDRLPGRLPALDLANAKALHFRHPDTNRFPCLELARQAVKKGGTMPAVLNAANEVAVQSFLEGEIRFSGIWRIVEAVMARHAVVKSPSLDEIMEVDAWARAMAREEGKG